MRSIQQLIQYLLKSQEDNDKRLFDTLKQTDDNILQLNNRVANIEKKNLRYFSRAYHNTTFSVPGTGVATPIPFNSTVYPQLGNMHHNTITPEKIYIRRNGVYHVYAGAIFAATAAGTFRAFSIVLNRGGVATPIASDVKTTPLAAVVSILTTSTAYYCYVGDSFEVQISQNAGAGTPIDLINDVRNHLAVVERREDLDPSEYGLLDPNENTRT